MHFEITHGLKRGKTLTSTQRNSSLFAEAPRIGAYTLRRDSPPLKLTELEYSRVQIQLKRLFLAGAIEIFAVSDEEGVTRSLEKRSLREMLEAAKTEAKERGEDVGLVVSRMLKDAFSFAADELTDLARDDRRSIPDLKELLSQGYSEMDAKAIIVEEKEVARAMRKGANTEDAYALGREARERYLSTQPQPIGEVAFDQVKITLPDGREVSTTRQALEAADSTIPIEQTLERIALANQSPAPDLRSAEQVEADARALANQPVVADLAVVEAVTPALQAEQQAALNVAALANQAVVSDPVQVVAGPPVVQVEAAPATVVEPVESTESTESKKKKSDRKNK